MDDIYIDLFFQLSKTIPTALHTRKRIPQTFSLTRKGSVGRGGSVPDAKAQICARCIISLFHEYGG